MDGDPWVANSGLQWVHVFDAPILFFFYVGPQKITRNLKVTNKTHEVNSNWKQESEKLTFLNLAAKVLSSFMLKRIK